LVRDLGWHAPLVGRCPLCQSYRISTMTKYCDQNMSGRLRTIRKKAPGQVDLFAGGIVARRNHDPKIRHLNERGWRKKMDVPRSSQPSLRALGVVYQARHLSAVSLEVSLAYGVPKAPSARRARDRGESVPGRFRIILRKRLAGSFIPASLEGGLPM